MRINSVKRAMPACLALAAIVVVACGGTETPVKEPDSIATPQPTEGAKSPAGGPGPMVTPGQVSEANAPPPPPAATASKPVRADGPCDLCSGRVTTDLQNDLTKRASASRDCYVKVLTNEPHAKASMTIEVKVGRDGTACNVDAKVDEPSYPGLADCVMAEYKKGGFAPPGAASCVVAHVPIQFTPSP